MNRQKSFESGLPVLYLVATPIGNMEELSSRAIRVLKEADVIAAEDTRNTGILLKRFDIETHMIAYHMFNEEESAKGIVDLLQQGKTVAVVSDAGYPLISDPGQTVVNHAIDAGFPVSVVSGPNAGLDALVASGLPVQPYTFYGFLNAKQAERRKQLEQLKNREETLIFYEAPHRIERTLNDLLAVFGDRKICLARELTKIHEEFTRGTISEVLASLDNPRGEMVLVVAGYEKDNQPVLSIPEIIDTVNEYIAAGMSASAAIRKTADEYGLSKNEVYHTYFNRA